MAFVILSSGFKADHAKQRKEEFGEKVAEKLKKNPGTLEVNRHPLEAAKPPRNLMRGRADIESQADHRESEESQGNRPGVATAT